MSSKIAGQIRKVFSQARYTRYLHLNCKSYEKKKLEKIKTTKTTTEKLNNLTMEIP